MPEEDERDLAGRVVLRALRQEQQRAAVQARGGCFFEAFRGSCCLLTGPPLGMAVQASCQEQQRFAALGVRRRPWLAFSVCWVCCLLVKLLPRTTLRGLWRGVVCVSSARARQTSSRRLQHCLGMPASSMRWHCRVHNSHVSVQQLQNKRKQEIRHCTTRLTATALPPTPQVRSPITVKHTTSHYKPLPSLKINHLNRPPPPPAGTSSRSQSRTTRPTPTCPASAIRCVGKLIIPCQCCSFACSASKARLPMYPADPELFLSGVGSTSPR